jgi:hypothetical protein
MPPACAAVSDNSVTLAPRIAMSHVLIGMTCLIRIELQPPGRSAALVCTAVIVAQGPIPVRSFGDPC